MKNIVIAMGLGLMAFTACNTKNVKQDGYKLVWSDEFGTNGLVDSTKWAYDTAGNSWGWGNNEAQWYTADSIKNAVIKDGYLHITARKELTMGKQYSSARIRTKGKADWLYGRFEINAKVPGTRGMWPAIWMLSTDNTYGGWPSSGEIDIMEHVGYIPDTIFASTHCESYYFKIGTQKTKPIVIPDCTTAFHTYTLEWDPEEIRMYVDTTQYFSFKNEHNTYKEWPFDKPFNLIMNVAVGGDWGGVMGIDTTAFPQEMVVDYVRVYQK